MLFWGQPEFGHIRARRQINSQLLLVARFVIILSNPPAHIRRCGPNHRIARSVIIHLTAENLGANRPLFEVRSLLTQGEIDDIAENMGQRVLLRNAPWRKILSSCSRTACRPTSSPGIQLSVNVIASPKT